MLILLSMSPLMIPPLFDEDFYEAIDLLTCVNQRKVYGGPAPESVEKQVELAKDFIAKHK